MAISFQYNKTYLQQLNKALKVRENALPTLVAKEAALRLEVKKAREQSVAVDRELETALISLESTYGLWNEFPDNFVTMSNLDIGTHKVAGVAVPILKAIAFAVAPYSMFSMPSWIPAGIELLKKLVELTVKKDLAHKKTVALEYARKKTTQKVNLYEKVQIPGYREAILKIKRFLEDEENLSKSSQKILKNRLAALELAA